MNYPHKPQNCECSKYRSQVVACTILSANQTFCKMSQYPEVTTNLQLPLPSPNPLLKSSNPFFFQDELVGASIYKLLPHAPYREVDHEKMNEHLVPQSPHMHVSEVLTRYGEILTKDGTLITGISNIQFFYNEGKVSFGVSSVLSFAPQHKTPSSSCCDACPFGE